MLPSRHGHSSSIPDGPRRNTRERRSPHRAFSKPDENPSFVIDIRGDRRNLEFGAPDRHAVPRFFSAGKGRLLGLHQGYRITTTSDTYREVEIPDLDLGQRQRKKSLLVRTPDEADDPIIRGDGSGVDSLESDFIPFEISRRKRRRRLSLSDNADSSTDDESDTANPLPDRALPPQSPDHCYIAFTDDPSHQKYMQLSKATLDDPENAQVWLRFIEYQDIEHKNQIRSGALGTGPARVLTEIKISIYQKALGHVKDPKGREILILGLMHEGRKIWDVQKQLSQWKDILRDNASIDVWRLYLNFEQTNFIDYSIEDCLKVYQRWLDVSLSSSSDRARDSQCIYILLRLSLFLWQSGFTELATGLWQALLELGFCSPANASRAENLASFEEFWNGEAARIGEEGANGWSSGQSREVAAQIDRRPQRIGKIKLDAWAPAEEDLVKNSAVPARSLDETDEEDPYRVVLFADIRPYLFFPSTVEGSLLLLDAFLLFCGLGPASSIAEARQWQTDPFLYSQQARSKTTRAVPVKTSARSDNTINPSTVQTLDGDNLELLQNEFFPNEERLVGVAPALVHHVLHQVSYLSRECLAKEIAVQCLLRLVETSTDLKAIRKQAKAFLKQFPNSLRLYHAYALVESRSGNLEAAERVWSTTLSMQIVMQACEDVNVFTVWRDWVWACISRRHFQRAKLLLTMMPNDQIDLPQIQEDKQNPEIGARVRAERFILSKLEACNFARSLQESVDLVDLLAIYRYLNDNCRLEAAMEVYSKYLSSLASSGEKASRSLESLHERRAELLHAHATTFGKAFKPRTIIQALGESVCLFPENLKLLQQHHHYTRQSGLFDRLRECDHGILPDKETFSQNSSIVRAVFDLSVELDRPTYSGSTVHSIRAAFRRAIDQGSSGFCSIGLWTAYILWELSLTNTSDRQFKSLDNVKNAFHASLRACPWSKELYMLGFRERTLLEALGLSGARQVYQSMIERGLRVRLDISDDLEDDHPEDRREQHRLYT